MGKISTGLDSIFRFIGSDLQSNAVLFLVSRTERLMQLSSNGYLQELLLCSSSSSYSLSVIQSPNAAQSDTSTKMDVGQSGGKISDLSFDEHNSDVKKLIDKIKKQKTKFSNSKNVIKANYQVVHKEDDSSNSDMGEKEEKREERRHQALHVKFTASESE